MYYNIKWAVGIKRVLYIILYNYTILHTTFFLLCHPDVQMFGLNKHIKFLFHNLLALL